MKDILAIVLLTFTFSCFSQTQGEMNQSAKKEFQKADDELKYVYQKIIMEYKSDTTFIKRLEESQRNWIAYRDSELEMKFPATNKQAKYGSVYPMCASIFLKELTEERTEVLKVWLRRNEEGNPCLGSVKMN